MLGARVWGNEKQRGAQRSAEKAGAIEGIQSAQDSYGKRERGNNLQMIFQGLCFEILFLMTYI